MLSQLTSSDVVSLCQSSGKWQPMRLLTQADIASFLADKPAAAIHFDANWDAKYRAVTRSAVADAEQVHGEHVNFGEVDCDPRYREQWLHKIDHEGVRRRAELLYQQLDGLQALRLSSTRKVVQRLATIS
jgi:hypothetical protein